MKQPLSRDSYEKFQKLIYSYLGLHFPANKKYLLENSLQSRLGVSQCQTFEEYYRYLQLDENGEREMIELTNCVTTNETFFFRDHIQIECFRSHLLPEIVARRESQKSIRIWSAGCSSGEEPYTLAMILEEDFPNLSTWNIEILATDVSTHVLAKAEEGRYGAYAIRNISEPLLKKHFTMADGQHEVNASLRKRVRFSMLNLISPSQMRTMRDVDLVLCRNVLIYFDEPGRQQIVSGFYDALRDHGSLLIGFSEVLHGIDKLFLSIPWERTMVYRKEEEKVTREGKNHNHDLTRCQKSLARNMAGITSKPK